MTSNAQGQYILHLGVEAIALDKVAMIEEVDRFLSLGLKSLPQE
jgi:hypothetical protein